MKWRVALMAVMAWWVGMSQTTQGLGRGEAPPEVVPNLYVIHTRPPGRMMTLSERAPDMAQRWGASVTPFTHYHRMGPPRMGVTVNRGISATSAPSTWVVSVPPTANGNDLVAALSGHPEVSLVEPVYVATLFGPPPNDPLYAQQSYLSQTELAQFWGLKGNGAITIALIDTGVDLTHPDLVHAVIQRETEPINGVDDDQNGVIDDRYGAAFTDSRPDGQPVDETGHGTHLAGIMVANYHNGVGMAGLSPFVRLLPIRVTQANGYMNQLDAARGIAYAVSQGAQIIVCAWGYYAVNQVLKDAIAHAQANGVMVLAAMGNSGTSVPEYPAALPGVIAIGAIGTNQVPLSFSSTGPHIGFVGYGGNIMSILPNLKSQAMSGTSQATAIVAGVVARMWSVKPGLTANELATLMILSADTLLEQRNPQTGYGILSPEKVYRHLNVTPAPPTFQSPTPSSASVVEPPWWLSVLLFPVRVVETVLGWVF